MIRNKLRLNKETLRSLNQTEAGQVAGGVMRPRPPGSALDCSAYPYICITKKPNGYCPILPDFF